MSANIRRDVILSAVALVLGCSPDTSGVGSINGADGGSDGAQDDGRDDETDGDGAGGSGITIANPNRKVDILFVVDNAATMGPEQSTLNGNVLSMLEVLERPDVAADVRLAFTTTDSGNPMCPDSAPEHGEFRLTSCRSRPGDFTLDGDEPLDEFEACSSRCAFDSIGIAPTPTDVDPTPLARPWIETRNGVNNLADSTCAEGQDCDTVPTLFEAVQCLLPQGIDGCAYPQPLESMYAALERARDQDDPAFGFLRDDAVLSVVFVTDRTDCSFSPDHESIFLPEGDRTFWSLPQADAPTPAVCWNAAAECDGGECSAADFDPLGQPTSADEAVMRPVSRYIEQLQAIEDDKQLTDADQEVLVSIVAGAGSDGEVTYAGSDDTAFVEEYGIGPGCSSAFGAVPPPLRLRELADALRVEDDDNIFSVCDSDYSLALNAVANALAAQLRPSCMPACVADTDDAVGLDPQCSVTERSTAPDGTVAEEDLVPCGEGGDVPEGVDACVQLLSDGRADAAGERAFLTEDRGDDLSRYCAERGWNLEVVVRRRWGVAAPDDAAVEVLCELSEQPALDCPALP